MNCAYIRLSEEDIKRNNNFSKSIENQIELIEEYAKNNQIKISKKFIDDGYSGINFCRPAFEEMLKQIEKNNIETIITKDFSRLGREYIETTFYITRYFPEHGIRYIAINENYDSLQASDEIMVVIKGIVNDMYIKDTSKKIRDVKKRKTASGNFMGYIAPYGYIKVKDNNRITLIPDKKVAPIVTEIFKEVAKGKSKLQVANKLNEQKIITPMQYMSITKSKGKRYFDKWTEDIIYRIIRNEIYIGNTYIRKSIKENYRQKKRDYIRLNDRKVIENTHQAIVSKQLFLQANSSIKRNRAKESRIKDYSSLLQGMVLCGECGKTMNISGAKKQNGKIVYNFYCSNAKNGSCDNCRVISAPKLENIICDYLKNEIEKVKQENIINNFFGKHNNIRIIEDLYFKKINNEITEEDFIQKKKQYSNEFRHNKLIEEYKEFQNKNCFMKYADRFVRCIKFYKNRSIEVVLRFINQS